MSVNDFGFYAVSAYSFSWRIIILPCLIEQASWHQRFMQVCVWRAVGLCNILTVFTGFLAKFQFIFVQKPQFQLVSGGRLWTGSQIFERFLYFLDHYIDWCIVYSMQSHFILVKSLWCCYMSYENEILFIQKNYTIFNGLCNVHCISSLALNHNKMFLLLLLLQLM